ncbi:MAG: hypothetical protein KatS3mg031_2902 [Chitinophagales bacterium]|nr:MAG: hypothetical protein KatS3mg031_2902 [Chitinophagales bacterium]
MKAEKEFLCSIILGVLSEANNRGEALPDAASLHILKEIAEELENPPRDDKHSIAMYLIFAELLTHFAILIEREVEHLIVSQN